MTATVRKLGLRDAFGIDHIIHQRLRCPAIKLDLFTDEGLCLYYKCLDEDHLAWVHFAPPCGTSTRARNIVKPGQYNPPPLRSREPDGMASMPMQFRGRVRSANQLYGTNIQVTWVIATSFWSIACSVVDL